MIETELTFEELKERLKTYDETVLIEELEIYSAMLVEAFEDIVYEKQDKLRGLINNE